MRALDDNIRVLQQMPADDPRWQEAQRIVKRTIALDFDGVLHKYSRGWQDGSIYDEPVADAENACWSLVEMGYELVIFTARQDKEAIHEWLAYHNFPQMEVTNMKPPALLYVDDRGLRFYDWCQAMSAIVRILPAIKDP